jgi:thiamine biosynthesis lipoprotein
LTASTSFPALGSTAVVMTGDGEHLDSAAAVVERVVADFDLACSRFREDSELEALNRAGGHPRAVSALLREAVRAGVRAAQLTDGDVDPTLGAFLIALGYDRDFSLGVDGRGAGAGTGAVGAARLGRPLSLTAVAGWRAIAVDDDAGTVTVPAGLVLDLGATAKALAADHAAAAAAQATATGVLVSLGGDIAIAGPAPGAGWPIRVTDDHRSGLDAPGQTITIASGGLATSSVTVRRWRTDGELRHHLLDPASGRPVTGPWRTASVAAASCLDANIAATAAIVRGQRAEAWLAQAGLPSRLVSGAGHARHLAGWPRAGDDLTPAAATEVAA